MKKKFILSTVALLTTVTVLCSCISIVKPQSHHTDASSPPLIYNAISSTESEETDPESKVESEPDEESVPVPDTTPPEFDDPDDYITLNPENGEIVLPSELKSLAAESMFVGDSVCRGFMAYGYVSAKQSFADGNIGARNVLETDVYYGGKERRFVSVLTTVKPKRLFFSMGMNDVNMTTAEEYYNNYKIAVDTALENCSAEVYLCAITPIRVDFTANGRIDEFNEQISNLVADYNTNGEERVHFVDYTAPLKDKDGKLLEKYDGGDGIHLAREVYFIALHEIYKLINE